MKSDFIEITRNAIHARTIRPQEKIQTLWSGYGEIVRYSVEGGTHASVVIKHVKLPDRQNHPRGWETDFSHKRKIRSYHVESNFYRDWSLLCGDHCRVPRAFAAEDSDDEFLMVLEDLDAAGYPVRKNSVSLREMESCLDWLANFHAVFMGKSPDGLWATGTYWHLETRPDELEVLDDQELKAAAPLIDKKLKAAKFQTIVHGDAKLANFCFASDGKRVAAVDFQYTGGGCGVKDVAYFIGSCLDEAGCEKHEARLLDYYFARLGDALRRESGSNINPEELEAEWRGLFPYAWADFHRFLKGWSPGHWKINSYSERITRDVIAALARS